MSVFDLQNTIHVQQATINCQSLGSNKDTPISILRSVCIICTGQSDSGRFLLRNYVFTLLTEGTVVVRYPLYHSSTVPQLFVSGIPLRHRLISSRESHSARKGNQMLQSLTRRSIIMEFTHPKFLYVFY
jgi:hypothetical protein